MANSLRNGWQLTKASGRLLMQEKALLVFPLLSGAACFAVMMSFVIPVLVLSGVLEGRYDVDRAATGAQALHYVLLLLFYFANYFIITFFNAALSACVIDHLRGGHPSVKSGLTVAASRLPQIVGWAALAATVGVILRSIAERSGLLGRIVISLMGAAWTITTYFVTPVLVAEQLGPIEATRRSLDLVRNAWGTAVVSNASVSLLVLLFTLLSLSSAAVGIATFAASDTASTFAVLALVGGLLFIFTALTLISLVSSTLRSIQAAVLYEFAANGAVPTGFDRQLLLSAFRAK